MASRREADAAMEAVGRLTPIVRSLRYASWPTVSTGVTGLTNVLLPVAMQTFAGAAATGALALSTTPLTLALSIQRAVLGQTFMRGIAQARALWTALIPTAVMAAAASAALVVVFGLSSSYLLISCAIPVFLFEDAFRYRAMGASVPRRAASVDLLWFVTSVASGATFLGATTVPHDFAVIASFGLGALVSAAVGSALWPQLPSRADQEHPPVTSLLLEGVFLSGLGALSQPVLAWAGGLDALGLLRIAQVTCAIPTFMLSSLQGTVMSRIGLRDERAVRRMAIISLGLLGAFAGVVISVLVLVPHRSFVAWQLLPERSFLWCVVLLQVGTATGAYVTVMMWRVRIITPVRSWLTARVAASVVELAVECVLGLAVGAPGVASGTLVNNSLVAYYVRRVDRQGRRSSRPDPSCAY